MIQPNPIVPQALKTMTRKDMSSTMPRILVVDSADADIANLAERLSEEYQVEFAEGGQNGLEKAGTNPPDLILLETRLQDMDSHEFCRLLNEDERTQRVPVILMTSLSEDLNEAKGLEVGAADYITKPFRFPLVLTRIKNNIELKRRGDLLEKLALLDGTTKLPNRQSFENTITAEWFRGQRSNEPLSLVICNLDEFRNYNDHFGHTMGNDCLYTVGKILQETASRASDLTARIGWEGFAIVLPCTDRNGAMKLAETIRSNVEAHAIPQAPTCQRPHITISLGVATMIPSRDSSPEVLFEEAAKALQEAKDTGRNRVVLAAEYKRLFG